ncbi:hypothetical protein C0992_008340 [Termitomyces sp. T32_za158]|nr:hypothetical protein C0992_008340 [Termitomyces sp. T32_za158]
MIVLSTLHKVLRQAVTGGVETAVLLTTSGQLVGYATAGERAKDEVWMVVGLAMEMWQETHEDSMVESEVGAGKDRGGAGGRRGDAGDAACADWVRVGRAGAQGGLLRRRWASADWRQGRVLVGHLGGELAKYREHLVK